MDFDRHAQLGMPSGILFFYADLIVGPTNGERVMKIAQICIILGALMLPTIGSVQYSHAQNEFPGIRLTGDGIGGVTTDYQLVPFGNATDGGFAIGSDANPGDQFFIMNPAPQAAININGTGMGIGTPFNVVDHTLHVRGGSGAAYPRARIFVEDVSTAPGFRTLLDLTNNGGIRIDLNDTSPDTVDWTIDTFNNTMSDGSRLTSFDIGHDTGFPFRIMGDTATNQAFLWEGGLTIGRNPINQPASGVVGNLEVFADGTSANGAFATISSRVDAPANSVARTSMHLENNGGIFMTFKDSSLDSEWTFGNSNDALRLGRTGGGQSGFLITNTGNFLFQFDQDGNGVAENMFFVNQTGTAFGTDFSRLSDK
ncbi:MAG: hypothetical protein AAF623_22230, partial [Planctomycetota bacterium]